MKKIILASVSSIALLGLVACGDTDNTTTQSIEPEVQETAPTAVPDNDTDVTVVPEAGTDEAAPTDDTTTQSIEGDEESGVTIVQPEGGSTDEAPMAAPQGSATDEVEPADDVPAVQ